MPLNNVKYRHLSFPPSEKHLYDVPAQETATADDKAREERGEGKWKNDTQQQERE